MKVSLCFFLLFLQVYELINIYFIGEGYFDDNKGFGIVILNVVGVDVVDVCFGKCIKCVFIGKKVKIIK